LPDSVLSAFPDAAGRAGRRMIPLPDESKGGGNFRAPAAGAVKGRHWYMKRLMPGGAGILPRRWRSRHSHGGPADRSAHSLDRHVCGQARKPPGLIDECLHVSLVKGFSVNSRGRRRPTVVKPRIGGVPTVLFRESDETSFGQLSSIASNRRRSESYSASGITGAWRWQQAFVVAANLLREPPMFLPGLRFRQIR